MDTNVLHSKCDLPDADVVKAAAELIKAGMTVAFPTETFYGLGADGLAEEAVRKIFWLKGRDYTKPILLIVDSIETVVSISEEWPEPANVLAKSFWPGPLTMVVKAAPFLPISLHAGTGKIGVRVPGCGFARELAAAVRGPVTATSANPSGQPPAVSSQDVEKYFAGRVQLIVNGGTLAGGSPSTVVDVTTQPCQIFREGPISSSQMSQALGGEIRQSTTNQRGT